ncbi:MAG: site-2 protease family protein [Endomicrobium sp.]|uniref:site-2 protease family protein n=1 Tax=Candidatus Endomicrobiellum pyrsonymphae TaxID=1408203 RepID=UPI003584EA7E|nr:site-2 protease family protein [Endomicrobium sp.]
MLTFIYVVVFLFSGVIHEVAHGYVAHLRGDDTAKMLGRITLNPLPHVELFGSIILPVTLLVMKAPFLFGWAKPVPVTYNNLKNPKIDVPLISIAGPLSNILLAVISGLGIRLIFAIPDFEAGFGGLLEPFLYIMLKVNVTLSVINLIPFPPLDASKVIAYFLPSSVATIYLDLMNSNPFLCMIILFLILSSGMIWRFIYSVINFFVTIFSGVALF